MPERGTAQRRPGTGALLFCGLSLLVGWTEPGLAQATRRPATVGPVAIGSNVPTYARDVAPILFERCVECHRPAGAAPFSLLTFEDARSRHRLIADTTARRYMPPWKPLPTHGGPYEGERRLDETQIATLRRWADAGAPAGDPADAPPTPAWPDGWRIGTPDLVVRLPQPYVLPPGGMDVFRNFAIPVPLSTTRCVRGIELRPGSRAVHHANMQIDRTGTSRRFDAGDPQPGYSGALPPDAEYPDGHFLGWTPGQSPSLLPDDMCWRLEPGSHLLLQVHMRPTAAPEAIQPTIAFYFANQPAARIPVMLRLGKQDIDISPGDRHYRIRDTYVLPVDVDVQAVQPHAHHLAREVAAFAELPDGSRRWLVHITDWDFNWQDVYRYAAPPPLPKGTRLVMEYTYDNSAGNVRNPHNPPHRVSWGQQTTDEMGDLWVQVLPREDRDRLRLAADSRAKALREDIVGYRTMLRRHPGDAALHESLAKCYLQVGEIGEALRSIQESVRLRPASAAGRYNLGTALAAHGRHGEAVGEFAEAVRLDPDFAYAYNSLGVSLHAVGRTAEAVAYFRRAIVIEPVYANAHNNLGRALEVQGQVQEAMAAYGQALRIEPDNPQTLQNMAGALVRVGRAREALAHYRRGLELRPESPGIAARLAWVLATDLDPGVRNLPEALAWAERAVIWTGRRDPTALDALGVAQAAAGRFEEAVASAQAALELAVAAKDERLATAIQERLDQYRRREPSRRDSAR